jgi:ketosteroid isomerase-like protein
MLPPVTPWLAFLLGAAAVLGARVVLVQGLLWKFRRDLRRLNAGDYRPLLSGYAPDAVLRFNDGPHRWSGVRRGRAQIEAFLREFAAARLQGEIRDAWVAGAPWALRIAVRFDDRAAGPDGSEIYANRTVLVLKTRWGRITEHEDFYEDTARLVDFDRRLRALGVPPAAEGGASAASVPPR